MPSDPKQVFTSVYLTGLLTFLVVVVVMALFLWMAGVVE